MSEQQTISFRAASPTPQLGVVVGLGPGQGAEGRGDTGNRRGPALTGKERVVPFQLPVVGELKQPP